MASRPLLRRFLIQTGTFAGQEHDGFEIGWQEYPGQADGQDSAFMNVLYKNNKPGIWFPDLQVKIELDTYPSRDISAQGIEFGPLLDLCVARDRTNQDLSVGDWLYVSSSGAVRLVQLTKVAKKPLFMGYGQYTRKLTVRDHEAEQTLVISFARNTVKTTAPI